MRILGVEIKGDCAHWIILDGNNMNWNIDLMEKNKLDLPKSENSPIENLIALKQLVFNTFQNKNIDEVRIIRADAHSASVIRIKIECMLQMACSELRINCSLIACQTITAIEKRKFLKVTGRNSSEVLNASQPLPQYLYRAALCAWSGLDGN